MFVSLQKTSITSTFAFKVFFLLSIFSNTYVMFPIMYE
jgi:hypothetical protein